MSYFKKIVLLSITGLIFLAPQKTGKTIKDIKKEKEGIQKQGWVEGQRGWAEDGTNIWTSVAPLPSYNVGIGTSTPSYKLDVVGNSRIQGSLYLNSWPISVTAAPAVGDVLKWDGTAFVPQADQTGTSEWLDAGEYLYPADDASQLTRAYESATPTSGYRFQAAYSSTIYGLIGTQYSGIQGNSDNASGAGVSGFGTGTSGVYGESDVGNTAVGAGVMGINTNTSGTGIIGLGSNVTTVYWSGNGDGVVGVADTDAYGVIGTNYNGVDGNRWGALGTPNNGVYGTTDQINGAVYGFGSNTQGFGGVFVGENAASWYRVTNYGGGISGNGNYYGVQGWGLDGTSGIGVLGVGMVSGLTSLSVGTGSGVTGITDGINGNAGVYGWTEDQTNGWGMYSDGDFGASGTKYAVVPTSKGYVGMAAMESPEVWFEDFGSGQLKNGKAYIKLDPLFLETVTIDDRHPMKVFITLTDECNGVYVKKGKDGFWVIELNNGTSNATFDWRVVAKRKGYEESRFVKKSPPPIHVAQLEKRIALKRVILHKNIKKLKYKRLK